jgi:hypothetical protein
MSDNYEFKYTDREYDVMMLKKELKNQIKSTTNDRHAEAADPDDRQEMNELIDSDPELYAADREDFEGEKGTLNFIKDFDEDYLFDDDDLSLEAPEDFIEAHRKMKQEESKIHNSFTGPYPLDPTEFSHTDKGENMQFTTLANALNA